MGEYKTQTISIHRSTCVDCEVIFTLILYVIIFIVVVVCSGGDGDGDDVSVCVY